MKDDTNGRFLSQCPKKQKNMSLKKDLMDYVTCQAVVINCFQCFYNKTGFFEFCLIEFRKGKRSMKSFSPEKTSVAVVYTRLLSTLNHAS